MPNKKHAETMKIIHTKDAEKMVAMFDPKVEGYDTAITDALANLRHLCDAKGLDFGKLDKIAYSHYIAEINGQD